MATSWAAGCNAGLQTYGFGMILVVGSCNLAVTGGGGATAGTIKGKGFTSVINTSAGLFTITFTHSALAVISCWSQVQIGSAVTVDLYAQVGTVDVVTARTAIIQLKTGATNTDPPATDAQNRLHWGFLMATSSLNQ